MSKRTKRAAAGVPGEKADTETAHTDETGETGPVAGTTFDVERRPASPSLLPDIDWGPVPQTADDSKH